MFHHLHLLPFSLFVLIIILCLLCHYFLLPILLLLPLPLLFPLFNIWLLLLLLALLLVLGLLLLLLFVLPLFLFPPLQSLAQPLFHPLLDKHLPLLSCKPDLLHFLLFLFKDKEAHPDDVLL